MSLTRTRIFVGFVTFCKNPTSPRNAARNFTKRTSGALSAQCLDRIIATASPLAVRRAAPLFIPRGLDDLGEAAWVQAGPADEGTVDIGLTH